MGCKCSWLCFQDQALTGLTVTSNGRVFERAAAATVAAVKCSSSCENINMDILQTSEHWWLWNLKPKSIQYRDFTTYDAKANSTFAWVLQICLNMYSEQFRTAGFSTFFTIFKGCKRLTVNRFECLKKINPFDTPKGIESVHIKQDSDSILSTFPTDLRSQLQPWRTWWSSCARRHWKSGTCRGLKRPRANSDQSKSVWLKISLVGS